MAVAATTLNVSRTDLVAALNSGKTIANVAAEKGVALDTIVDAFIAPRVTAINSAVASGRITQAQADATIAAVKANVTAQLNAAWTPRSNGNGSGVCDGTGSNFVDNNGDGVCDNLPAWQNRPANRGGGRWNRQVEPHSRHGMRSRLLIEQPAFLSRAPSAPDTHFLHNRSLQSGHICMERSPMNGQPILKSLSLDFNDRSPAVNRRRRIVWTQRACRLTQLGFALFIIAGSVAHQTAVTDGNTPSIDGLCPFGGVETLWRFLSSGGQYVPKTHLSNPVLLGGLVIGTLIAGGAFCGWVCPFGAVQDALNGLRKRLGIRPVELPAKLDKMVADIAHELRTPVAVIQGNLRAMLDGVYPLERSEIATIHDETLLLNRLIDDLRELALMDAGQLTLSIQPVDVAASLRATADRFSALAEARGITLDAASASPALYALADPHRLAQILRNLLSNAIRHTPAGGRVTLAAAPAGAMVEISVRDTGPGMTVEEAARVFDRFYRGDRSRARESGGSGLGLAIARALAQAMGGQIGVDSAPGQGSRFWFTLPAAREPVEQRG